MAQRPNEAKPTANLCLRRRATVKRPMAPVLASPARAAPLLAGRVLPPMSSMPTAAVAVPLPMPDGVPALPLHDSPPEGPSGIAERRIWSAEEDDASVCDSARAMASASPPSAASGARGGVSGEVDADIASAEV